MADLLWPSAQHGLHRYVYGVMPDHAHLATSPLAGGPDIPTLLQAFKSHTTRAAWRLGIDGALWQRSYYDHIARNDEDCLAICHYTLENPVRRGLVRHAGDWPYSGLVEPLS
ncbi:MAG: transposase [Chloroflexota bacterium]|nr:transposase [Chloroflexota bacterium]